MKKMEADDIRMLISSKISDVNHDLNIMQELILKYRGPKPAELDVCIEYDFYYAALKYKQALQDLYKEIKYK